MSKLYLLTVIVPRDDDKHVHKILENSVALIWHNFANGTAKSDILDVLGLEKTEKTVLFTVCATETAKDILNTLVEKMMIDVPGNGIAFTVPLASIVGRKTMELVTLGQNVTIDEEEQTLKDTEYEVIYAIANQEYTDLVMDAARSAGASGGTVVHAKGTQSKEVEKFRGMTLADEKGVVMILTKTEQKNAIMQAIAREAGKESKAESIVFSLPVTRVVGLREKVEIEEV